MSQEARNRSVAVSMVIGWVGLSWMFPYFMPLDAAMLLGMFGGMGIGAWAVVLALR